ncbi:MAG: hypothetical protein ACJ8LG_18070 [Massilia sp.]
MSNQQSNTGNSPGHGGNAPHAGASETVSVGGLTSGEEGATPTHETMQETGGSGGAGLTRHEGDTPGQAAPAGGAAKDRQECAPEGADSAATHIVRGYQDTRSHQAGGSDTGLGTPETGANQTPADMERRKK